MFFGNWLQKGIHGSLESGGSIAQAKWHYAVLVMPLVSVEHSFRNVLVCHQI